jgi:hypothetical protein
MPSGRVGWGRDGYTDRQGRENRTPLYAGWMKRDSSRARRGVCVSQAMRNETITCHEHEDARWSKMVHEPNMW